MDTLAVCKGDEPQQAEESAEEEAQAEVLSKLLKGSVFAEGGKKKNRGLRGVLPDIKRKRKAKWDFDLRLPCSLGNLSPGDHFFEFADARHKWMLNVAVGEDKYLVGVYLHSDKERRATCSFRIGTYNVSLNPNGRVISAHPDRGWGVQLPVNHVHNCFKILLTPVDVTEELLSRDTKRASVWDDTNVKIGDSPSVSRQASLLHPSRPGTRGSARASINAFP